MARIVIDDSSNRPPVIDGFKIDIPAALSLNKLKEILDQILGTLDDNQRGDLGLFKGGPGSGWHGPPQGTHAGGTPLKYVPDHVWERAGQRTGYKTVRTAIKTLRKNEVLPKSKGTQWHLKLEREGKVVGYLVGSDSRASTVLSSEMSPKPDSVEITLGKADGEPLDLIGSIDELISSMNDAQKERWIELNEFDPGDFDEALLEAAEKYPEEVLSSLLEVFIETQTEGSEKDYAPQESEAEKFWAEHWHEILPRSGRGRFSLQAHLECLTEEESKLDYEELCGLGKDIHFIIRHTSSDPESLWGYTIYAGISRGNEEPRIFDVTLGKSSRGEFNLPQPKSQLTLTEDSCISETGKFTKIVRLDRGVYELGVVRRHSAEIQYSGKRFKGIYIMGYAPAEDQRNWLLLKPNGQKCYATTHDKEMVTEELREKNQEYLYWRAFGGDRSELVNVKEFELGGGGR